MKSNNKYLLLLVTALLGAVSSAVAKNINIKGTYTNVPTSTNIYLYQLLGLESMKLDSCKVNNGVFKFKPTNLPKGLYKIGISESNSFNIILGEEDIELKADADKPNELPVISNSLENKVYQSILLYNTQFANQTSRLDQLAQPILGYRQTDPERFNREIGVLQLKMDSLNKAKSVFFNELIDKNKTLFATKLANIYANSEKTSKEDFFVSTDFTDEELTRGDFLSTKIILFLQKHVVSQESDVVKESSNLLLKPYTGTKNKEVFYITLIKIFAPYDAEYARTLGQVYKSEFPNSKFAKKTFQSLPKGAPQVGESAPEITLNDANGKPLSLSSLRGKIVLLDFWASWCGPCRKENPNVVRVYDKYKDKGFTIFSVSLDTEKDKWLQAIQKDQLKWSNHVSDLKGWQSAGAATYSVKGIPATFLIGKDGKIIATNLRGEELENKLSELFKSE